MPVETKTVSDDRVKEINAEAILNKNRIFPHCCPWSIISYNEIRMLTEEIKRLRSVKPAEVKDEA